MGSQDFGDLKAAFTMQNHIGKNTRLVGKRQRRAEISNRAKSVSIIAACADQPNDRREKRWIVIDYHDRWFCPGHPAALLSLQGDDVMNVGEEILYQRESRSLAHAGNSK